MKKLVGLVTVLAVAITPNLANANQAEKQKKIAVVKKIYQNIDNRHNTIPNLSTADFRNLLIVGQEYGEVGCTPWDWVGGQDHSQAVVNRTTKYQVLTNGDVKVSYKLMKNSKTYSNIFKMKKVGGKYQINDIYYEGRSMRSDIRTCIAEG